MLYADIAPFITGGSPMFMDMYGGSDFNPSYAAFESGFTLTAASDFISDKRYACDLSMNFKLSSSVSVSVKYGGILSNAALLRFNLNARMARNFYAGISMNNFLTGDSTYGFDVGCLWDTGEYLYGLSIVNLGNINAGAGLIGMYDVGPFPATRFPFLNFTGTDGEILKSGMITNIMFKSGRLYMTALFDFYISSVEDLKDISAANFKWGALYGISEDTMLGFGQNSEFNSLGLVYRIWKITVKYAYLWQPSKFSHHLFSLALQF